MLWNLQGSLQARADGVLLAAVVAAVAAGSAVLTLAVMRRFEGRSLRGSTLARPTRWVMATGRPKDGSVETGPETVTAS